MLHACFVCIPTCFMCTLIQYLAFSGTNLLTRCHSVSSCFLLFLYFRKVLQEIFSELHGTKTQHLIIPSRSHSQKRRRSGATRWPDTRPARPAWGPRPACVWSHQGAPDSASSPIYSPYRENPGYPREIPRKV